MDLLQREGRYPLPPQAPKTLGVEFSGVVEKLSPEAEGFKEGDKVFGLAYGGMYTPHHISCSLDVNGPPQVLMQNTSLSQQRCVFTSLKNSHLKKPQVFPRYVDIHCIIQHNIKNI